MNIGIIKKLKKVGLIFLGTLMYFTSYSQENFIPGYIIKDANDTINGFVDYRNWDKNPDAISFKTDTANNAISYKPIDIIEFGAENEIYVSGVVKIEVSTADLSKLTYDPKVELEVDTIFLQTLFRGKKELYYYKNRDGKGNYYIKQDSGYELLIYKQYLKNQEEKHIPILVENKTYLGQLSLYMNDCPKIQTRLKNTTYKQGSLYKIFKYYNDWFGSDISFSREVKKLSAEFGILLGPSLTTLEFSYYDYLSIDENNPSLNLSGGLFVDLILPRNQGKWSINNELLVASYSFSSDNEDTLNFSSTEKGLSYTFLKINTLVRFKYPIGQAFWYINGGISNGFVIKEPEYLEKNYLYYKYLKHELSYVLGSGIKFKKYSFEVRAERRDIGSEDFPPFVKTTRYYFLFGYKF